MNLLELWTLACEHLLLMLVRNTLKYIYACAYIIAGWVDINLTVTPITIPLLFNLLSDSALPIRLATSTALLRIVSKGLKEPGDKLQLIKVLSLDQVLNALEERTRAEQLARKSKQEEDEDEESYREALGKLLNVFGGELIKLLEVSASDLYFNYSSHASFRSQMLKVYVWK
jgi:hypothetical protein